MSTMWDFPRFASDLLKAGSAHIDSDPVLSDVSATTTNARGPAVLVRFPEPPDVVVDPCDRLHDQLVMLAQVIESDTLTVALALDALVQIPKGLIEILGGPDVVRRVLGTLDFELLCHSDSSSSVVGASAVTDAGSSTPDPTEEEPPSLADLVEDLADVVAGLRLFAARREANR